MPATLATPSLFQHPGADDHRAEQSCNSTSATTSEGAEPEGGPFLRSDALLQGRKTVAIAHNGFVYRLQATRLGKLILTK